MFAVIALVLFVISWFEHGSKASGIPVWFDWQGVALLGLACVAVHLFWPGWPRRP